MVISKRKHSAAIWADVHYKLKLDESYVTNKDVLFPW